MHSENVYRRYGKACMHSESVYRRPGYSKTKFKGKSFSLTKENGQLSRGLKVAIEHRLCATGLYA